MAGAGFHEGTRKLVMGVESPARAEAPKMENGVKFKREEPREGHVGGGWWCLEAWAGHMGPAGETRSLQSGQRGVTEA